MSLFAKVRVVGFALGLIAVSFGVVAADFKEGKEYTKIPSHILSSPLLQMQQPSTSAQQEATKSKVVVTEFFSYGCPACNAVAPELKAWADAKNDTVVFQKVPVEFFKGWDILARAYYIAEMLEVLDKVDLALFDLIHNQKRNITDKKALEAFFKQHGVDQKQFDKMYDSFAVNRSMERGQMLMRLYKIGSVPTVIVNNQYQTDLGKTRDLKKFIDVLDYLVNQSES